MKQTLTCAFVLAFGLCASAQEKEKTTVKTTTTTTTTTPAKSGFDLLGGETWNVSDATAFETGAWDLRLAVRYTESARTSPGNGGKGSSRVRSGNGASNEDNAWIMQPVLVWGVAENWELSFTMPVNHFDNLSDAPDGNFDSYIGALWHLRDQVDYWPAIALASNLRIPTGEGSSGFDWELRLALTNEYDSGIRSHFNLFGITVNHDNYEGVRDFQYGAVAGLDGPLCNDGAVRWVADWMYRISDEDGGGGQNIGEAGVQWQINECNKLGLSLQMGLDHAETTSDVGAAMTYAYTIRN